MDHKYPDAKINHVGGDEYKKNCRTLLDWATDGEARKLAFLLNQIDFQLDDLNQAYFQAEKNGHTKAMSVLERGGACLDCVRDLWYERMQSYRK